MDYLNVNQFDRAKAVSRFALCVLIPCLSVAVYRVLLHPLSRYPGPFLARVSAWHNFYNVSRGDRHLELYRQHEKYGSIVRFAPNSLSFNTTAALQDIYGARTANVVKSEWYRTIHYAEKGGVNTFTAIDREQHRAKRRMLSYAFSEDALRGMESLVQGHVRRWCDHLGQGATRDTWTKGSNMGILSTYLTFDVLGDLCFGKSFDVVDSDKMRFVVDLIPANTGAAYKIGYHPLSKLLRYVLFSTPLGNLLARQTIHDVDAFTAFCVSALAERRQVQIATVKSSGCLPRQDFFHYLFQKREIEAGSEDVEVDLEAESRLLTIAGSDTSSTALAACFFYLVRNEGSLNKLTSDIRATFSSIDEIRHASLSPSSLPYLRACLDETMRLAPPVPAHIPREVLSSGAVIDGRFYPAGTVVGICTYALHHNADYFPDPFRFYPERWIVDTSKGVTAESVATSHAAFCPFSIGVRGCIGKNLAYLEMSLTLAITLWQYDIRKKSGDEIGAGGPGKALGRHRPGEYQLKDVFVTTRDGPVVEFKVRADIHGIS